ncbi:uncharacterized protein LOC124556769 [Schistocerca americana]|uniref:uncharacterized protein LOC124556769 n=1 Tax=Schistocerca americana TaxID=7009 RepID=UPI001F4FDE13|nr:uncharacterized protein LOC124556769 [Schistocerca americana]
MSGQRNTSQQLLSGTLASPGRRQKCDPCRTSSQWGGLSRLIDRSLAPSDRPLRCPIDAAGSRSRKRKFGFLRVSPCGLERGLPGCRRCGMTKHRNLRGGKTEGERCSTKKR